MLESWKEVVEAGLIQFWFHFLMFYKTYVFDENEEDLSEGDYGENVENFSNISSTPVSEFVIIFYYVSSRTFIDGIFCVLFIVATDTARKNAEIGVSSKNAMCV